MPGKNGPVLSHRFAEWMMGFPPGWVADIDIPKPTKRQPNRTLPMPRTVAIRLLGNTVVTDQALVALKILLNRIRESAR